MTDPAPPADQAARDRIATRTDETLFVTAGAGSGKTTALVGRVTRLVLHDDIPVSAIATVTFTLKAGAELRDRLRAAFEKIVRTDDDPVHRARAERALDDLDLAAIGTLHSFAQRILAAHPIEAGLPPAIEVLDEVGSSIAFEERWSRLQQDLLDDDSIAEPLILGMAAGMTLRHLRQLVRLLGQDWDRVATHVLSDPPAPLALPDLAPVTAALIGLGELRTRCTKTTDLLYVKITELEEQLQRVASTSTLRELLEALPAVIDFKLGNSGAKGNWSGEDPKLLREQIKDLIVSIGALRTAVVGQCLRHLTFWAGTRVLAEAEDRRRSGRLEFHDLLVLARELVTPSTDSLLDARAADARATLHATYQRLLLDEFQDTDPIQIELAVRIAGGRDATQPDWKDVVVPEGQLFVVGDAKQSIYRFRRASISTYLTAQDVLGSGDATTSLSTNFRSDPGVVDWVNAVFGELIQFEAEGQPAYEPQVAHRSAHPAMVGPPVTVLGHEAHPKMSAAAVRDREAADVAGIVTEILTQGWTVFDEADKTWRPARARDIAVLIPSRRSMSQLEDALDAAGLHFRAEAMSLVYESPEIRDVLAVARAVADPSDALALVAALRSPLFACGDDDLWAWRHAGGYLDLFAKAPSPELAAGPVGQSLEYLVRLQRSSSWLAPSEVLARIVEDRRVLELSASQRRSEDAWRRIRFLLDQARAWTEATQGGLRGYLGWVAHQAQEKSRVSEAILPEHDVDAVRVMTVHAAKGLEFPIVILSGMTTAPMMQYGARLLWTSTSYTVSLKADLSDPVFEGAAEIEEQMGELERRRLLYVATTRARDHLVVSLHRTEQERKTPAEVIAAAGGAEKQSPTAFTRDPGAVVETPRTPPVEPLPEFEGWLAGVAAARRASKTSKVITASGREGSEPEVLLAEAEAAGSAGLAKGGRDLDLPPWSKGRYGSAVGRAVHGVLQVVDLDTGAGLADAVRGQVVAEGIVEHSEVVTRLASSALASEVVQRAAAREHWRELYVGAPQPDGTLLEGIIDLLYREDDGSLVVVDYKTDVVNAATLDAKVTFYRPQLQAYRDLVEQTTGAQAQSRLLFLHPEGSHLAEV